MKKIMVVGLVCAAAIMILAAGCCSQCKCKMDKKCDVKTTGAKDAPAAPAGK